MQKIITVDSNTNKLPNIEWKENDAGDDKPFITVEVKLQNGEMWRGVVRTISSNGKYKVELQEKIADAQ